jgi:hypothetical protein
MADKLRVDVVAADSFRRALSESRWAGGDVEAACMLRQGEAPSMASAMIGIGLFKLLKRKGVKDLPRAFVLAVTADRVVAFDASAHSEGEGTDALYKVSIKPGELGSWPRDQVSMTPAEDGITSNAVLDLAGAKMPCAVPNSDAEGAFAELEAALGGAPAG